MLQFTQGNLLDARVEAVVNTVNTVGVMGKGIALMFKERFPENFRRYAAACKANEVHVGKMFVTATGEFDGPRWIINFPTKKHWRNPTELSWVIDGLQALRHEIEADQIRSIAIPPLGCGNGGLNWADVRPLIESALAGLDDVEIVVYEPTAKYQNVAKHKGVEQLTPARAMVAELVRRYWVLGIECTVLEIQKLAWFLERSLEDMELDNPLDLQFKADKYGPYADRLRHLLDSLDGSYLHCDKRLSDASPLDIIWFDETKRDVVTAYLKSSEARPYMPALERTDLLIDGFQSPLGMEVLATVDWLIQREDCSATVDAIKDALHHWPAGKPAAARKLRLFDDPLIDLALIRLQSVAVAGA